MEGNWKKREGDTYLVRSHSTLKIINSEQNHRYEGEQEERS